MRLPEVKVGAGVPELMVRLAIGRMSGMSCWESRCHVEDVEGPVKASELPAQLPNERIELLQQSTYHILRQGFAPLTC
eukprot:scaffold30706_cov17-Tisochrysis_lutea.AAC.1